MLIPRSLLARTISPVEETGGTGESQKFESPPNDPIDSLRCVIKAELFEGYCDIHLTSEAAGMSVRTLQRRLIEEGLTYSMLLDDVRFNRAIILLQDPDSKIIDIALDMGYENPGSFTRAFRRWSGFSPQEFRTLNYTTQIDESVARIAVGA
jgi:AraC-like DNA-binding protein